jgi:2-methylisocitrate lyase-like PEP mutase family enzyme
MPPTQHEKGAGFRALHDGEAFVIPNPWDAGSAKVLAGLGFRALASTSSGFAFTLGRPDGAVTLDEVVEHAGVLDRATSLPVSVDLENGYGPGRQDVARAIARVAEAGAVGASIEDYDADDGIYAVQRAVERVAAAAEAARLLDFPFTLTARAENHIRGNPDLSVSEIAAAGGRRISVGGALTWVAVGALAAAAERIRDHGDFSMLVAPYPTSAW